MMIEFATYLDLHCQGQTQYQMHKMEGKFHGLYMNHPDNKHAEWYE